MQRARSPEDVPSANVTLDTLAPSAGDVWVNALWFTTLGLSLSTVLVAVLVKQWLQVRIHVGLDHTPLIPIIALGICQDTSRTPTRPRADTPSALQGAYTMEDPLHHWPRADAFARLSRFVLSGTHCLSFRIVVRHHLRCHGPHWCNVHLLHRDSYSWLHLLGMRLPNTYLSRGTRLVATQLEGVCCMAHCMLLKV